MWFDVMNQYEGIGKGIFFFVIRAVKNSAHSQWLCHDVMLNEEWKVYCKLNISLPDPKEIAFLKPSHYRPRT